MCIQRHVIINRSCSCSMMNEMILDFSSLSSKLFFDDSKELTAVCMKTSASLDCGSSAHDLTRAIKFINCDIVFSELFTMSANSEDGVR